MIDNVTIPVRFKNEILIQAEDFVTVREIAIKNLWTVFHQIGYHDNIIQRKVYL